MKKPNKLSALKREMSYRGKRTAEPENGSEKRTVLRKERTKLRRQKLSRRELMILLVPALAAVVAVIVVLFTVDRGSTYTLSTSGHQYYGGSSAVIAAGTELKRTDDGLIQFDDGEAKDSYLPIYLDEQRTFVVIGDMLYYAPSNKSVGLVRCFSEVNHKENGLVTVTNEGKSVKPEAGFLYDGNDFYIFLEPVSISCMGYTVELPALSYAEVVNGGNVMLFNYETQEFFVEMLDGSATANAVRGGYTISLLGDTMTARDGERTLLSARPELFEPIV